MVWLWFILGQVLNILRQAKLVAQSRSNPISSPWKWIHRNWVGLLVREAFAIGFWLVLVHQNAGPAIIESLKPGWGQYARVFVDIPFLALPFGIVFSIAADERLESSPNIKKHLPKFEDSEADNGRGTE